VSVPVRQPSLPLFERVLADDDAAACFADAALLGRMLEIEVALARAEAEEGVIGASAAEAIARGRDALVLDGALPERVARDGARAGTVVVPLVAALREAVERIDSLAVPAVHLGATSQDLIDTAMALATRDALVHIDRDAARLVASLVALAERHRTTPMLARTLMQPAGATSFGFKAAGWAAPVARGRIRVAEAAREALQLSFGGAFGTLAALGAAGPAVARRLGAALDLPAPVAARHVQRDAWVALGCALAVLCGSLGKIGGDVALLAQGEVGELAEPAGEGRGTSSAMPHKRNPVAALKAIAAAVRAPQLAATLLAAMPQAHERGLGDWQAELATWPALVVATAGAARALADAAEEGLVVDAARMRANLAAAGLGDDTEADVGIAAERARDLIDSLRSPAA
jgi:3-carboxy-cis,cis-muconate cycloisomerase